MHCQNDREIRQKEFICKPCHKELKDGKYSKNVQNCPNSDMFGSDVNHDQHSQDNVEESRTHPANNITCDFLLVIQLSLPHSQITVCVHVAITLIYQDHNVSYSKNQGTIVTILLL